MFYVDFDGEVQNLALAKRIWTDGDKLLADYGCVCCDPLILTPFNNRTEAKFMLKQIANHIADGALLLDAEKAMKDYNADDE